MRESCLPSEDRMFRILADGATENSDERNAMELREFLGADPGVDREALEVVAARLILKGSPEEPLPNHLRNRILSDARKFFAWNEE